VTTLGARRDIRIERLVYGGDGLGRDADGRAIFAPGALPGELVRVEIVETHATFARARLVETLEPSPLRRVPPCQYYGECGGCQLQHAAYEAQIAAKREFIREAFTRIGRIAWDAPIPVLAGPEWEYRGRAQFKIAPGQAPNHAKFGFYRAGANDLCEIDACRLLAPPLNHALDALRRSPEPAAAKAVSFALGDADNRGAPAISASPPGFGFTDAPVTQRIGEFTYAHDAGGFFQVNLPLVETLVHEAVLKWPDSGRTAIDLYAGAGLFTLPLARRFETVRSVEESSASSAYAVKNCSLNGIRNVSCVNQSVERWLMGADFAQSVPLILIDPPRAGLTKAARHGIARLAPGKITYVSCDPTTLARDVRFFTDRGYRLESVVGIDLFPQTYHVETVVRLVQTEIPHAQAKSRLTPTNF
jgi:23S rRNA (uracil1939-C5)-methyltransferase